MRESSCAMRGHVRIQFALLRRHAIAAITAVFVALASAGGASGAADDLSDRIAIVERARAFFSADNPSIPVALASVAERRPFATVRFTGPVEGSRFRGILLFRRYSFGWQLVNLSGTRLRPCDLQAFGVPNDAIRALVAPSNDLPNPNTACSLKSIETRGPTFHDETLIRELLQSESGEAISNVRIADGYALVGWSGHGGGSWVFAKRGSHWEKIGGGGGVIGLTALTGYGVPTGSARALLR